jgi:Na+-transporting methylmalonyl-CoA/oxaloacetate decarboxylase gamma subunit
LAASSLAFFEEALAVVLALALLLVVVVEGMGRLLPTKKAAP